MVLDLHYGGAVSGNQRFDRPTLEARLIRALETSAGIKMFGLRRIGKSTLRERVREHLDGQKRPHIFIDGQGLHSLVDFLGRIAAETRGEGSLLQRAAGRAVGPAANALKALTKGEVCEETLVSAYWSHVSDGIKASLEDGTAPVLIVDEFSYLLGNMIKRSGCEDVDRLLATMREWRGAGMSMLLTGSIGLTALARTHGFSMEHLNDLQPFKVPELTEAEARAFLREATEEPSEGRWTDAHTEVFLAQSGVFYPCFLVCGLNEIGVEDPPPPEDMPDIFSERVRPNLHADFYRQFDRRFKDYGALPNGERDKVIQPALQAILGAQAPLAQRDIALADRRAENALSLALDILEEDGVLRFTEDANGIRLWKPASRLVTLWWNRRGGA